MGYPVLEAHRKLLSKNSHMKQVASGMHETSAQGWSTGMTQRDGMAREVGGVQYGEHM